MDRILASLSDLKKTANGTIATLKNAHRIKSNRINSLKKRRYELNKLAKSIIGDIDREISATRERQKTPNGDYAAGRRDTDLL